MPVELSFFDALPLLRGNDEYLQFDYSPLSLIVKGDTPTLHIKRRSLRICDRLPHLLRNIFLSFLRLLFFYIIIKL